MNDLLSADDKRGGLVRLEPHSELIREDDDGVVRPLDENDDFFNQNQDQTSLYQQNQDQTLFYYQTQDRNDEEENPWAQQKVE